MTMPKVSVIMPTYNRARYIYEAIDSILAQTYQDFEVIVVDDGSIDNTSQIVENYVRKYTNRVKYYKQKNMGVSGARNKGIKEAQGEYIAFLDDDDIADKGWLENLLNGFHSEEIGVSAGRAVSIAHDYTLLQSISALNSPFDEGLPDGSYISLFMICSSMIKKRVFDSIGVFDENFTYGAEDNDFNYRVNLAGFKTVFVKNAVVYYRPRTTLKQLLLQRFRYGVSKISIYKKYKIYRKNIVQDSADFISGAIRLLVRTLARVLKFVFFKKHRKSILVFEHPVSLLCLISNHCGRLVSRIRNNMWF